MPVTGALNGAPAPLAVTCTVPSCVPVTCGANVTATMQLAPGAIVTVQAFWAMAKPWLAATEMPLSAFVPVLITVSICGDEIECTPWIPKSIVNGDGVAEKPLVVDGGVPVPFSATTCASSASWIVI